MNKKEYGIEELYVWSCHQKDQNNWIPDSTSLLKQSKENEEEKNAEKDEELDHEEFY